MPPLIYITGASSGIGQALAARFLAAGWRLALVARRANALQDWVDAQQAPAGMLALYPADVRNVDAINAAGRACIAAQGLPDVVVANAGISIGFDTAEAADLDVMRAVYETNNIGMAATFQPFVHAMQQRGSGRLVGMASVAGIRGLPGHGAYCASKAAVISYCESLRGECRPFGVSVLTLLPGYVRTPLTAQNRYSMPFSLSATEFADRAFRAISGRSSYRVIPWQMGLAAWLMRGLPNAAFDALLKGRPRKHRQTPQASP
jgi:short-subunit dehydrogenase